MKPTFDAWRAQVEAELKGVPFDKALVHETAEGLRVQPLYVEATAGAELASIMARRPERPVRVCVRCKDVAELREALAGGADAVWLSGLADGDSRAVLQTVDLRSTFVVGEGPMFRFRLLKAAHRLGIVPGELRFLQAVDPLADRARGLGEHADGLLRRAKYVSLRHPEAHVALVSTLPYHDAGADAADELAIALSTGAAYLRALTSDDQHGEGLALAAVARQIAVQIAIGRDTFGELCKLRALRLCWEKLLLAAGVPAPAPLLIHAVCSSRTLSTRDPWVNMLRATTQVFAATLGGADLVTPTAFDAAIGADTALGRRVARNTGLVLREESQLGRVVDPAGGSYYLETHTDLLAREAWKRFQALEREGGIEDALASGRLRTRLEAAWAKRLQLLARRKEAVLGVSDFAKLDEERPRRVTTGARDLRGDSALPVHRDSEDWELLRDRAEALGLDRAQVVLVPLGPASEHRPRLGFAAGLFPAGGLRTVNGEHGLVVCLCGSDERYAEEAANRARALKAGGSRRVLLAGRPGALEGALREAGVDDFVFVGSDVAASLLAILDVLS